jgi:hypothetical protein
MILRHVQYCVFCRFKPGISLYEYRRFCEKLLTDSLAVLSCIFVW